MNTLFFPGWGLPPETYVPFFPEAEITDYGFFSDAPAASLTPPEILGEPIRLIGHSLGTLLAIQTALKFPDQVESLTLYAPFVRFTETDGIPGHAVTSVESMLRQCAVSPERMLRAFRRNLYHPSPAPDTPSPAFINAERLAAGLRFLLDTDLTPLLPALARIRTTIIYGDADAIVPHEMTEHFLALLPHAGSISVNTGHMGILESEECGK